MRKITGNKKGIDTILAALLMVVIVVVAAVMVYAWSTGLLGTLLINPKNNQDGPLTADTSYPCQTSATCNSVIINIRNSGTLSVTLNSYYITDSSNNQWGNANFNNATIINPNTVLAYTFYIGTAKGCTYSGSASAPFASGFASGAYSIKVVTARGTPFTMTFSK